MGTVFKSEGIQLPAFPFSMGTRGLFWAELSHLCLDFPIERLCAPVINSETSIYNYGKILWLDLIGMQEDVGGAYGTGKEGSEGELNSGCSQKLHKLKKNTCTYVPK